MPNTVYAQMDNKQHSTEVLPKESFENEYSGFIIDATEKTGDYVVENAVNEMSAQGVDTSILTDGEVPSIAEVSYSNRRSANYIYKVREDELKKASVSKEAFDELKSRIDANLDEQDKKDCFRQFPKILLSGRASFKTDQIVMDEDATKYADILLAIREDLRNIRIPSDKYNSYAKTVGQTTYSLKTFTGRPVVFMRADLYDAIEINFASGVFNLDKIKLEADIVRVPTFYSADRQTEDTDVLWLTTGRDFVRIYKDYEKRARLEEVRGYNISKAVTYIEYTSKLVPAIMHTAEASEGNGGEE